MTTRTRRTPEEIAADYQRKANAARAKAAKAKRNRDTRYYVELGKTFETMTLKGQLDIGGKEDWTALLIANSYHGSKGEGQAFLEAELRRRFEKPEDADAKDDAKPTAEPAASSSKAREIELAEVRAEWPERAVEMYRDLEAALKNQNRYGAAGYLLTSLSEEGKLPLMWAKEMVAHLLELEVGIPQARELLKGSLNDLQQRKGNR